MYKVGDKVRVTNLRHSRDWDVRVGDVFEVVRTDSDGDVYVKSLENQNRLLIKSEIEKVEESKEMTFPEMVQKLIDGEFEVGTGLIATDKNGKNKRYEAVRNLCGYGINTEESITPNYINGSWIVEEQPIKEMSIEELQKELGYKIKIVERESK